ncbi:hypothetical protein K432DRAFT_160324 [Lepidopterella palustris CBS 459.81]|uniref:Uncharacterized protein n=1 Tax=Lepidopterella palustris CBS 459.81 TaxID=1314670 RepID=A0A8E2JB43_9PEZI|nr:hypothetical protein K432DRAFT_160324 [Lepidopterella palustris CBS 459.81]
MLFININSLYSFPLRSSSRQCCVLWYIFFVSCICISCLDKLGGDGKYRLAVVAWYFDGSMQPSCTKELIHFVSAAYNFPCLEISKTMREGSRYSNKGTHKEKDEVFVSTLKNILETCRECINHHPFGSDKG